MSDTIIRNGVMEEIGSKIYKWVQKNLRLSQL